MWSFGFFTVFSCDEDPNRVILSFSQFLHEKLEIAVLKFGTCEVLIRIGQRDE